MPDNDQPTGISFKNIRINSTVSSSGVFAGHNIQYNWSSGTTTQVGFGTITGDENVLENQCSVVTDQASSNDLLEYFRGLAEKKIGE